MINNDRSFKQAINRLTDDQQRQVATLFIQNVAELSKDETLSRKIEQLSSIANMSDADKAMSVKAVKNTMFNFHTRCGSDCEWSEQAVYFLSRAVLAILGACCANKAIAWAAASNSRMAKTCSMVDDDNENIHLESSEQYQILTDFLDAEGVEI